MIDSTYMALQPQLFITVIENDEGYMAIGSRKVSSLEITAATEYFETQNWKSFDNYLIQGPKSFEIAGVTHTLTTVQGRSRMGVIGQLLEAFDEEKRLEEEEKRERQKRQQDLARFGGEIDEELVRKIIKWRKKKAKKYEEDDYYEDRYE